MKILITAFEPFGLRSHNTSTDLLRAVQKSAKRIANSSYTYKILPVNFQRAWPSLRQKLNSAKPDLVLLLGEKTGGCLTIESRAQNTKTSKNGLKPIEKKSPASLLAHACMQTGYRKLLQQKSASGIFSLSRNAGNYLCNFIYYKILSLRPNIPALFVHVHALTEKEFAKQNKKYVRAITKLIRELAKAIDGVRANGMPREN